jgi:hypothetical protein
MQRHPLRRVLVTALLLAALATPAAWAEGPSARAQGAAGFSSSLLDFLHRIQGGLVNLWVGNGAGLDPSGGPAADNSDNGAGLDPDGNRAAGQDGNLASDNGCGIDPSGGCQL